MARMTAAEFWNTVDRTGDCWLWAGKPYGDVAVDGITLSPVRMAYQLKHGSIPNNGTANIMHSCKTAGCLNPAHLYVMRIGVYERWLIRFALRP